MAGGMRETYRIKGVIGTGPVDPFVEGVIGTGSVDPFVGLGADGDSDGGLRAEGLTS